MPNERMYPLLPCVDLDESIAFYEALGFTKTYRQLRPNPAAVVALDDMAVHLFGMDGFKAADSYGSVIITVPDADDLYRKFAAGLRAAYGKLPVVGIPRLLRPRKKFGTVQGFSVVDPGGNWLRIYKQGDTDEEGKGEGLAGILSVATRLGDARGDEDLALKTLESGLARFTEAAAIERAQAYLYRAELAVRVKNHALAQASLAAVNALDLTADERAAIADEYAHAAQLIDQEQPDQG